MINIIKVIAILAIFTSCNMASTSDNKDSGCNHTNLSFKYDYKILIKKEKNENGMITIEIIDKSTKQTKQTIGVNLKPNPTNVFTNCSDTRSYITGYNKKKEIADNDYGDLIVADLNLDGQEDLTIKIGSGGFGPEYKYFTMTDNGTFEEADWSEVEKGWKIIDANRENGVIENSSSSKSSTTDKDSNGNTCSDEDAYSLGEKYAQSQRNLIADCDYLYDMAQAQEGQINHYCFCKGVNAWRQRNGQ